MLYVYSFILPLITRGGESSDRILIDDEKREIANVSALKNEANRREHLDLEARMRESNVAKTVTTAKVRKKRSISNEHTDFVLKKSVQPPIRTVFGPLSMVETTNDKNSETEDDDDEVQSDSSQSAFN